MSWQIIGDEQQVEQPQAASGGFQIIGDEDSSPISLDAYDVKTYGQNRAVIERMGTSEKIQELGKAAARTGLSIFETIGQGFQMAGEQFARIDQPVGVLAADTLRNVGDSLTLNKLKRDYLLEKKGFTDEQVAQNEWVPRNIYKLADFVESLDPSPREEVSADSNLLSRTGETMRKFYGDLKKEFPRGDYEEFEGSFFENPSVTRTIVEGADMLAPALVIASVGVATRSPQAAIAASAGVSGSAAYIQAREAGLSPEEADEPALITGVATAGLERVIGPIGRNILGDAVQGFKRRVFNTVEAFVRGSVTEGAQTAFAENAVAKEYYDESRDLLEGVGLAMLFGGMFDSVGAAVMPQARQQVEAAYQELKRNGVTDDEISALVSDYKTAMVEATPEINALVEQNIDTHIADINSTKEQIKLQQEAIRQQEESAINPLVEQEVKERDALEARIKRNEQVALLEAEAVLNDLNSMIVDTDAGERLIAELNGLIEARREIKTKGADEEFLQDFISQMEVGFDNIGLDIETQKAARENMSALKQIVSRNNALVRQKNDVSAKIGQIQEQARKDIESLTAYESLGGKVKIFKRGMRKGRKIQKMETSAAQGILRTMIKESQLSKEAKVDFLVQIPSVNTLTELESIVDSISEKINKKIESEKIKRAEDSVKTTLKKAAVVTKDRKKKSPVDVETTNFLRDIVAIKKMKQDEASSALAQHLRNPEDGILYNARTTALDIQARGASASAASWQKHQADLAMIYETGKLQKDVDNIIKTAQFIGDRDQLVESAESRKAADSFVMKSFRGFYGNVGDYIQQFFGKKSFEKYSLVEKQWRAASRLHKETLDVIGEAKGIFGVNTEHGVARKLREIGYDRGAYSLTKTNGKRPENLTTVEALDIYNAIKNKDTLQDYYATYGEGPINNLVNSLPPDAMAFADLLQDLVQAEYDTLRQSILESTGIDLGFVENYWPKSSELASDQDYDLFFDLDNFNANSLPSFTKSRSEKRQRPRIGNAWSKYQSYKYQANYAKDVFPTYRKLKELLRDPEVRDAVYDKFGEGAYVEMMDSLEDSSLRKSLERIIASDKLFNYVNSSVITNILAYNPGVVFSQLSAVASYAEKMPTLSFISGLTKATVNPKGTIDFMLREFPEIAQRYASGDDRFLAEALRENPGLFNSRKNPKASKAASVFSYYNTKAGRVATIGIRIADAGAIVFGGKPYYDYLLTKHSKEKAKEIFLRDTLMANPAPFSSANSKYQNSKNVLTKTLFAFTSTLSQFVRKIANAHVAYRNGEISLKQYAKTGAVYSIVAGFLYEALRAAVAGVEEFLTGEEKEQLLDFEHRVVLSSLPFFGAIPLFGDGIDFLAQESIAGKSYGVDQIGRTPLVRSTIDIANEINNFTLDEDDAFTWSSALGLLLATSDMVTKTGASKILEMVGIEK